MRATVVLFLLLICLQSVYGTIDVIPLPDIAQQLEGDGFLFAESTTIIFDPGLESQAKQLNEYLSTAFGFHLSVAKKANSVNSIKLKINDDNAQLGKEGYKLTITSDEIVIKSYKPAGIFYGIQTLRQLLPPEIYSKRKVENIIWKVPCLKIEDKPELACRSFVLNVCKQSMSVDFVKKQIGLMALYKMNRLCWRFGDNYTKQQVNEIVNYAKERFVKVVIGSPLPCDYNKIDASFLDFDFYQTIPANQPFGVRGSYLPIEKVYSYEPNLLNSESAVEASIDVELMASAKDVECMIWPRACALAEIAWTQGNKRDFNSFNERLNRHYLIFSMLNVNCFKEKNMTKPEDCLRVMTYNVLYGGEKGRDYKWYYQKKYMGYQITANERIDNIINIIKNVNPDIVFLQECNGWAGDGSKILKDVTGKLNMYGAVTPNRNKFKVSILSRFPMSNIRWLDNQAPFAHNILFADITLDSGRLVSVACLHFGWWGDPNWRKYNAVEQKNYYSKQYDFLLKELAQNRNRLFIVGGDFNHTFEEANFGRKSLYSSITKMGYVDSCLSVYKDYGKVLSGTQENVVRTGPIDFIFVSPALSGSVKNANIFYSVDSFETSDHLPVWADIKIEQPANLYAGRN